MAWELKEPYGYTIFCDDLRLEVGNKISYMGTYHGEMIVPLPYPFAIPKLIITSFLATPPKYTGKKTVINIYLPTPDGPVLAVSSEAVIGEGVDPKNFTDASGDSNVLMVRNAVVISPLSLTAEGKVRVRATIEGDSTEIRLGALNIRSGEIPVPA